MLGSQILEVAVGILFVFTLVSIVCTAIREGIEAWFKTRSAFLEYGIRELLHDKQAENLVKNFYNHPLIFSLFSEPYSPKSLGRKPSAFTGGSNLPSYIPARNFALALMDIAARGQETDVVSSDPESPPITLTSIRLNIANIKNQPVQRILLAAIDSAQGDIIKAQAAIEDWYNSGMDRVSGWYRRSTQWVIFWVALFTTVSLNINTISIANHLYFNASTRTDAVTHAEALLRNQTLSTAEIPSSIQEMQSLGLPIGWDQEWGIQQPGRVGFKSFGWWSHVFAPILGWLLTAMAATLGAPFWFDVLNKVMVIRSTVKPHEKSPEEASEDRQFPKSAKGFGGWGLSAPLASPVPQVEATPSRQKLPTPRDAESNLDGCHVAAEILTSDEDLPQAEGGVS